MLSFNEITSSATPTLLDFFATWCGPCKVMPSIFKELSDQVGDSMRILKVDVDKSQGLSQALNVQGVPTLALFQSGKMLWRQSGVIPAFQLAQIIKERASLEA